MKAKTHLSQNKLRGGFTLVEMLVVIGMIAALAGISFPVYRGIQKKVDRQQFIMIMDSIDRAVDNFETEYNYLPHVAAYPGGDASLGNILKDAEVDQFISELYGMRTNSNFKAIKFFECQEAKPAGAGYRDGLHDNGNGTVTLYDSSGNPFYRMAVDYDMDGNIYDPFTWTEPYVTGHKVLIFLPGPDGVIAGADPTGTKPQNLDNIYNWTTAARPNNGL